VCLHTHIYNACMWYVYTVFNPQEDPEDLHFKKGDIMVVIRKDEEEWWFVKHSDGRTGSIPVPYIEVVSCRWLYMPVRCIRFHFMIAMNKEAYIPFFFLFFCNKIWYVLCTYVNCINDSDWTCERESIAFPIAYTQQPVIHSQTWNFVNPVRFLFTDLVTIVNIHCHDCWCDYQNWLLIVCFCPCIDRRQHK